MDKWHAGFIHLLYSALPRHGSNALERLFEVGNNVDHVLNAHREANEAVVNASTTALLRRHVDMRGARRLEIKYKEQEDIRDEGNARG